MKTLIFDLDGTMYRGTSIIKSAKEFLEYCQRRNVPTLFLTNNSMRTKRQNVKHMLDMGYTGIDESLFYNSAMAACQYAKTNYHISRAYYIGKDGLKEAMEEYKIHYDEIEPEAVFIGLNKEATYSDYSKALTYLLNGAKLIGTNQDRILASEHGFEVGNGSVVTMFEYASNQKSPDIAKPNKPILEFCLKHFNLDKEDIVLIGDNLETDIKLGYDNGIKTVFVETGVHTCKDLCNHNVIPTVIVKNLMELVDIDFLNSSWYNL